MPETSPLFLLRIPAFPFETILESSRIAYMAWYNDPRNMTAHTIISTSVVWLPFEEQKQSVAGWLVEAINGEMKDYGLDLVNKQY